MLLLAGACLLAGLRPARADADASADEGLRVFKSANCAGCHKWDGEGGGSYGGAGANLRRTTLNLQQIEMTVRCGRIGSGMPHFDPNAYTDGRCYGLKKSQLTQATIPPEPDHPLQPAEIDAVAKYVVTHIKGQGAPTLAQCRAFFGSATKACDSYASGGGAVQPASASAAGGHTHPKVEAAPDANAPGK